MNAWPWPVSGARISTSRPTRLTTAQPQMNITATSTKAEIIDGAVELIDSQAEELSQLKQQNQVLLTIVTILAAALVIF